MSAVRISVFGRTVLPILACTVMLSAGGPARGQEGRRAVAVSLGEVLGSEKFCGLTYDQGAVTTFMDKNVAKDDPDFAGRLRMVTGWTQYRDGIMSVDDKTDECAQIERMARSYGFIR